MTDPATSLDNAATIEPATTAPRRGVDYESLIDRFHASGLTQKAFCERENVSYHGFKNHYRRSPKFAGKRRPDRASSSAFRPVRSSPAPSLTTTRSTTSTTTIRIGTAVVVECPVEIALEAIARLAAEASR